MDQKETVASYGQLGGAENDWPTTTDSLVLTARKCNLNHKKKHIKVIHQPLSGLRGLIWITFIVDTNWLSQASRLVDSRLERLHGEAG